MHPDLVRLATIVAFILVGVLLLLDSITIKNGLAIDSFALAGFALSSLAWWGGRP